MISEKLAYIILKNSMLTNSTEGLKWLYNDYYFYELINFTRYNRELLEWLEKNKIQEYDDDSETDPNDDCPGGYTSSHWKNSDKKLGYINYEDCMNCNF